MESIEHVVSMHSWPILSFLIVSPLFGALLLLLMRGNGEQVKRNARHTALWSSMVTFVLSLLMWRQFDPTDTGYQFIEYTEWFKGYNIAYHLGVDGISLFLILLTTLLTPICILASWESIQHRLREYLISFLLLEAMVIGVFSAMDFVLFYLFFEGMLIPMYLIIGVWGGDNRVYAAFKFFLYTLAGSVLLLVAMLFIYNQAGTMSIPALTQILPLYTLEVQQWLWLALFASFAVKIPMWPVHTWLPDAHVQAPTAGSVILAGILLKMGGYGFIRFSIPMLPDASMYFADFVFILSVIAVVYTSLVALMQEDMKKLIAYSSVAHMGFVTIGLFTFNPEGIAGGMMQMISHGLVSGALFLCVGVVYDRIHTREIARYGGLVNRMPYYAVFFLFFTMASIGLPGTANFVGEILVLAGAFKVQTWVAFVGATGMILGAAYMLWLYRRVMLGELTKNDLKDIMDINRREALTFLPLVLLTIWLGIYPAPVLDVLAPAIDKILGQACGPMESFEICGLR
jgi:NADH-quinone oxidoreductase subunit M